jgi:hypothetical protein
MVTVTDMPDWYLRLAIETFERAGDGSRIIKRNPSRLNCKPLLTYPSDPVSVHPCREARSLPRCAMSRSTKTWN